MVRVQGYDVNDIAGHGLVSVLEVGLCGEHDKVFDGVELIAFLDLYSGVPGEVVFWYALPESVGVFECFMGP